MRCLEGIRNVVSSIMIFFCLFFFIIEWGQCARSFQVVQDCSLHLLPVVPRHRAPTVWQGVTEQERVWACTGHSRILLLSSSTQHMQQCGHQGAVPKLLQPGQWAHSSPCAMAQSSSTPSCSTPLQPPACTSLSSCSKPGWHLYQQRMGTGNWVLFWGSWWHFLEAKGFVNHFSYWVRHSQSS